MILDLGFGYYFDYFDFHLLALVSFSWLIFWFFVRISLPFLLSIFFPKLFTNWKWSQKEDVYGRIISIMHAFVFASMMYIFFTNENFYRELDLFSPDPRVTLTLCCSVGYFSYDLLYLLYNPTSLDNVHIFHHIVTLVSILSIFITGIKYHVAASIYWMTEISSPFSNSIFLLKHFGLRHTTLYKVNSVLLLVSYLVFRIINIYVLVTYILYVNWDRIVVHKWWQVGNCVFAHVAATAMNTMWMKKVVVGVWKILREKKVKDVDSTKKE